MSKIKRLQEAENILQSELGGDYNSARSKDIKSYNKSLNKYNDKNDTLSEAIKRRNKGK